MQAKGILEDEVDPSLPEDPPAQEAAESPAVEEGEDEAPSDPKAVAQAMDVVMGKLYDENVSDGIAKALSHASDPVRSVVEQATLLLNLSDEATNGSVPDDLYMMFALDVLGEVIEIAQAAGIKLGGRDIAVIVREFITTTVEDMGGDTSQVKEAMAQINPDELGSAMEQGG